MRAIIDLDGVLIDFVSGALKAHNSDPIEFEEMKLDEALGLTQHEFLEKFKYPEFWIDLDWMPDGKLILEIIEEHFNDIVICTSPGILPESVIGKMGWVEKHIPQYLHKTVFTSSKHILAHSKSILFDDHHKNVINFGKSGGNAVLVPRDWNVGKGEDAVDWVLKGIEGVLV